MITNLFSSFDPSTSLNLSLNWLSSLFTIFFIPLSFWFTPSRYTIFWNKIIFTLHKEFKIIINSSFKGRTLIFISLFRFLLFNNFLGLFPYIFTSSRHIVTNISLALPLWARFIAYGWINNITHILAHLVPQGTPGVLISFIVLIESIRNLIRPRTLAIRLTANIIAGHLLITLLRSTRSRIRILILNLLIISQLCLIILESAVAVIQSYVFSVLRILYSREVV